MHFIFSFHCFILLITSSLCLKLEIFSNGVAVDRSLNTKTKETLQLTCKLSEEHDNVTIIWRGKNSYRSWSKNEPILNIPSVHGTDNGVYTCICLELNISATFWLHVQVPRKPFCGDQMFVCWDAGNCIYSSYVCDGRKDCKNGEDEHFTVCGRDPCEDKIRNCRDGRCIPTSWCCDPELDYNCTVKEKPSCCRQQYKLVQDHDSANNISSLKSSIFKATLFSLCLGAVIFFFSISTCLLVLCRIHIHSCPANQDIREVCARTRIPFYDFYLYLNRNWNNLDHSRALCRSSSRCYTRQSQLDSPGEEENGRYLGRNALPHSILLMSYVNNEVQYVHRSSNPPPYSEVDSSEVEPPPPYVSRENIAGNQVNVDTSDTQENQRFRRGYALVPTESDDDNIITTTANDNSRDSDNNVVDSDQNNRNKNMKLLNKGTNESSDNYVTPNASFASADSFVSVDSNSNERRRKFDIKKLRLDFFGAGINQPEMNGNVFEEEQASAHCSRYTDNPDLRETHVESGTSRSQEDLVDNRACGSSLRQVPLLKYNSGSLEVAKQSKDVAVTRHSIADLSPSASNEYRCFQVADYQHMLTLPLRESFIGLKK